MITECTPNEDNAKRNNNPNVKSVNVIPFPNGITIQPDNAKVKVKIGAKLKIQKSELFGAIDSFNKSFKPSASA
jgi:hypothetical protein